MKSTLTKWIYLGVIMIAGAVFGSLFVQLLSTDQVSNIGMTISDYSKWIAKYGGQASSTIYWDLFFNYFVWTALIFLLGLSVVGVPLIILLLFIKGFVVGATIHFIIEGVGTDGLLIGVSSQLPHMMLVIPALLCLSSAAISFASSIVLKRSIQINVKEKLMSYSTVAMGMLLVLALSAWIQIHVTPAAMSWVFTRTNM